MCLYGGFELFAEGLTKQMFIYVGNFDAVKVVCSFIWLVTTVSVCVCFSTRIMSSHFWSCTVRCCSQLYREFLNSDINLVRTKYVSVVYALATRISRF